MRAAPLVCAALLLAGHALAQDAAGGGDGAMCRGFCDADAKRCRADAKDLGAHEAAPLDPNDFNVHAHPQAPHDDFSNEKQRAVERAADQDRFAASQTCTAARRACVQRCAAPAAASASAP